MADIARLRTLSAKDADNDLLTELVAFYSGEQAQAIDLDTTDDEPLAFVSVDYLDKFRKKLIESDRFTQDEIDVIMRHARGYAGGKASAAARQRTEDADQFMQLAAVVDVRTMQFNDAGMTPWLQITPAAGTKFQHPRYGEVEFTREKAADMKSHFDGKVYQEHIPVDAEHATKLSGALGYYRELRVRNDGALEARIELTDRGKQLRSTFKYFSPEFFKTWADPASGKAYNNLLVGGAFTTRPFFKDQHLAPLAASEQYEVWSFEGSTTMGNRFKRDADGKLELDKDGDPILTDEAAEADKQAAVEASEKEDEALQSAFMEMMGKRKKKGYKMSEEDTAALFMEMRKRKRGGHMMSEEDVDAWAKEREGDPEPGGDAKTFAEQYPEQAQRFAAIEAENERLKTEAQTQRFTDIVRGRDGEGDGRPWVGETEKHVGFLVSLSEKFGEDSDEVTHYIAREREHAEQIHAGNLFSEQGSSETVETSASEDKAMKAAEELVKANPDMNLGEALNQVLSEQPELYSGALVEQDD